ncbi:MAG: 3-isopropylmalate dehydrogenase [Nitrospinae bacterium]|nr:3-isopropylmalate dehydrogenase [Nitrospinota bacterium]
MKNIGDILALPGDGIGAEVVKEGLKVLDAVSKKHGFTYNLKNGLVGGAAYDATGNPLPPETLRMAKEAAAVLLGAVGGPKWEPLDYSVRPERALLGLRSELGLFANLRPARVFPELADASTLKREVVEGTDLLVVRELTGGIYFGKPKGITMLEDGTERGVNTLVYTTGEIERIAKVAFEIARKRGKKVASIDKANVLECTELWRRVVTKVHKDFQDVALSHMYVDNCAMQLIRNPKQFDVILTTNMFGDILSDEAAMLTGSIGMLPSASIGLKNGMYEPVHGSAPDIAGQGKANPLATILSVGMMLKYSFGLLAAAEAIDRAVSSALKKGYRTPDIMAPGCGAVGTAEMGDKVVENLG